MKCPKCQAVMNPKWDRCMVCGSPAFDAEISAVIHGLDQVWDEKRIRMMDITQDKRKRAFDLEKEITQAANKKDAARVRDALESWRRCWIL